MQLSDRYPHRRAFVTGAASGLGRALARHLAQEGWTVGMADVAEAGLTDAAEDIEDLGGHPHRMVMDVTDPAAVQTAAKAFVDAHEGVDLVVNNAGIGAGGRFEETSLADWEAVLNVNLMGVVHGCRAFLPHLVDNPKGGHLMNVASLAAVAAAPRMSAYNVSKAGVRVLSETLYGEYRDEGVHVCVLMPGFFETDIDAAMRGPESARAMARTLMERSDLSADEVAAHALREAGRDRIHILMTDWRSLLIWHFRRFLPGTYVRQLPNREAEIRRKLE
jgi:NAD(P)-dependent dehydrogenase (short-subunit alcohol dehydrogenase family)